MLSLQVTVNIRKDDQNEQHQWRLTAFSVASRSVSYAWWRCAALQAPGRALEYLLIVLGNPQWETAKSTLNAVQGLLSVDVHILYRLW